MDLDEHCTQDFKRHIVAFRQSNIKNINLIINILFTTDGLQSIFQVNALKSSKYNMTTSRGLLAMFENWPLFTFLKHINGVFVIDSSVHIIPKKKHVCLCNLSLKCNNLLCLRSEKKVIVSYQNHFFACCHNSLEVFSALNSIY